MMAIERSKKADGSFEEVPPNAQEFIMELVASVHQRDGKRHDDGSMGTIVISPKQLRDYLAYMLSY